MCDPVTLGALALSVAGGVGQAQTNRSFVSAQNKANKDAYALSKKARDAERVRQKGFEGRGHDTFEDTLSGMTRENFEGDTDASAESFVADLNKTPDAISTNTTLAGNDGANVAVKDSITGSIRKAAAGARERVSALAALTAAGGTSGNRATMFGEGADALSTIGGLRRGSLGVANQEQSIVPANVTRGDDTFAQILSGAGMMLGMAGPSIFGAGGSGLFGGGTTAVSPTAQRVFGNTMTKSVAPLARPIYG